jgi:hypothetical protein
MSTHPPARWVKRSRREAHHSYPSSAQRKDEWSSPFRDGVRRDKHWLCAYFEVPARVYDWMVILSAISWLPSVFSPLSHSPWTLILKSRLQWPDFKSLSDNEVAFVACPCLPVPGYCCVCGGVGAGKTPVILHLELKQDGGPVMSTQDVVDSWRGCISFELIKISMPMILFC